MGDLTPQTALTTYPNQLDFGDWNTCAPAMNAAASLLYGTFPGIYLTRSTVDDGFMLSSITFEQDISGTTLLRGVNHEFYDQLRSPTAGAEDIFVKSVKFNLGVEAETGKLGICYLRVELAETSKNSA